MSTAEAIRLHPADTVVVALRDVAAGSLVRWQGAEQSGELTARDTVPLGHKISLVAVACGGPVSKYGAPIGTATQQIPAGAHVHVHNLASARATRRP